MAEPSPAPAPARRPWKVWTWPLHAQILLGLVIGAGLGLALGMLTVDRIPAEIAGDQRGVAGGRLVRDTALFAVFELLGDLFLHALFVIIIPLVTSTIFIAVARIGGSKDFGRLGLKTLGYYLATSLVAILTGLVLVNLFAPGLAGGVGILEGQDLSAFQDAQAEVTRRVEGRQLADFLNVFRAMIPTNLVSAAAEGNFLGLIVISIVAGYLVTKLVPDRRAALETVIEAISDLAMLATHLVLRLAPIGVMFLIARTFAEQYATLWPDDRFASFITGITKFAAVALAALATHFLVTMPLILLLVAKVNPLRHYKAMMPALLTAFSTASSSATLPVTLECVEQRAGVSSRVAGFTLPIGATVNMDGTALYECVSAIFICQAFGIERVCAAGDHRAGRADDQHRGRRGPVGLARRDRDHPAHRGGPAPAGAVGQPGARHGAAVRVRPPARHDPVRRQRVRRLGRRRHDRPHRGRDRRARQPLILRTGDTR